MVDGVIGFLNHVVSHVVVADKASLESATIPSLHVMDQVVME